MKTLHHSCIVRLKSYYAYWVELQILITDRVAMYNSTTVCMFVTEKASHVHTRVHVAIKQDFNGEDKQLYR